MPYKHRDPWSRAVRAYIAEQTGLAERTEYIYREWLNRAGELLGRPNPRNVRLCDMALLESKLGDSENTRAVRATIVRKFLISMENREALGWKIISRQRPKQDGVFLMENEIEDIRKTARKMGVVYEILFSLGVDNGMRSVDMRRLTVRNAKQFMEHGHSMILSKGRNGGKRRLLIMSELTFSPLVRYLELREEMVKRHGTTHQALLLAESWKGLNPPGVRWIGRNMQRLSEASGIRFTCHDLRRTFGNRHWRIGTPIETIAALMGHETIDQTFKCYIGVQFSDMREAQLKLCPSPLSQ